MSSPSWGTIPFGGRFNRAFEQTQQYALIGSHWDEDQRVFFTGIKESPVEDTFDVSFRAARACLWVTIHVQSESTGGRDYDAATFESSTRYDMRQDRVREIEVTTDGAQSYYIWAIPEFEQTADGTFYKYDGVDADDHMAFTEIRKQSVSASDITAGTFGPGDYTFPGELTVTGQITANSHIIPDADGQNDLGSASIFWRDVYADQVHLQSNGDLYSTGRINIKPSQQLWMQPNTGNTNLLVYLFPSGTGTSTKIRMHNSADLANGGSVEFNLDGQNLQLFADNSGTGTLPTTFRVDMDIIPVLDGTYDLGSTSRRWDAAYFNNLNVASGQIEVLGTAGLDLNPGSDQDTDIITVGVTGSPRIYWDESQDQFRSTKGININTAGTANDGAITIGAINNWDLWTENNDLELHIGIVGQELFEFSQNDFRPSTGGVDLGSSTTAWDNVYGNRYRLQNNGTMLAVQDTDRFGNAGWRFQGSNTNQTAAVSMAPTGTEDRSIFRLYNDSDTANTDSLEVEVDGTFARLRAGQGFGTPATEITDFYINMANSAATSSLRLQVNGSDHLTAGAAAGGDTWVNVPGVLRVGNEIRLSDGAVGDPALTFTSQETTGLYYTSSTLNWAIAGERQMYLNSQGLSLLDPTQANLWFYENDAAVDEGNYRLTVAGGNFLIQALTDAGVASNSLAFVNNGSGVANVIYSYATIRPNADSSFDLGTSSFRWANLYADTATLNNVIAEDGSAAAPTYSFGLNTTTGMYRSAFALNFALSGDRVGWFDTSEINTHIFYVYGEDGSHNARFRVVPGTNGKPAMQLFNTNFVTDNSNYEFMEFSYVGSTAVLKTASGGTGTTRPFELRWDNTTVMSMESSSALRMHGDLVPDSTGGADLGSASLKFGTVFTNALRVDDGDALGGGATPTLGTIGGTGPATAAQNSWLKVNISGVSHWIPVWR